MASTTWTLTTYFDGIATRLAVRIPRTLDGAQHQIDRAVERAIKDGAPEWIRGAETAADDLGEYLLAEEVLGTDEQIEELLAGAEAAGDHLQVALCRIALTEWAETADLDDLPDEVASRLLEMGIVPEHVGSEDRAREECIAALLETASAALDGGPEAVR